MNVSKMPDLEQPSFDPSKYWEDRLKRSYGLHGVGTLGLGVGYNTWLYRIRGQVFRRILKRLSADLRHARVLDIGSGTGFYIEQWKAVRAVEIEGVDLTEVAVEKLRHRFPDVLFRKGDIGGSTFDVSIPSFDFVSCMDVLFHITDDQAYERAFRNVASVLKPSGIFIFSDNFIRGQERRLKHIVHRSRETIDQCLKKAGLVPLFRCPMFVLMSHPVDSDSRLLHGFSRLVERTAVRSNLLGTIIGGALYPVESLLIRLFNESASTEVLVCQKVDHPCTS